MRWSSGITPKLFLAVLVTNVVTALAVGFGVRAAFNTGFEDYVREREDQRLTRLAAVLASAYRESGAWDLLRGNDALWVELNHQVRPAMPPGGMRLPLPREGQELPFGLPREGGLRLPPAAVLDNAGVRVVGDARAGASARRKPIMVDGARVGWLAAPVLGTAFDMVDRRFQQEQLRAGWIVGLIAVALSAIVAWFLARGLIAPVKRLAAATRRLADGDYTTRVAKGPRDEIGALVDDFNRLGNALDKHEKARRNLMADVSHELRTPIAVLKGELEAIEDGVRPANRETIASLQGEVARLVKLVNDIHDLALADVGGLAYDFAPVDLAGLVRERMARNEERIAAHPLTLELDIAPSGAFVRADATRLAQLIDNLIDNSLRYTDAGGRLRVALRREPSEAVLDWEDSAPGVPEEALGKVFERLYRVEASRNRERGGSGLGLAIVQSIAQAHGGTVLARASRLGGLWIELRLPLASP